MKEDWKHITQESICPSLDELEQYSDGRLPESKRFALENHLAGCEACNDYLDGLAVLPENIDLDILENELKNEVRAMLDRKLNRRIVPLFYRRLAVAASILLVLGTSFYLFFNKDVITQQLSEQIISLSDSTVEIAENKEVLVKAEPSAPVVSTIAQNIPRQTIQVESKSKSSDLDVVEKDEIAVLENLSMAENREYQMAMDQSIAEDEKIISEDDAIAAGTAIVNEESKSEPDIQNAMRVRVLSSKPEEGFVRGVVLDQTGQPLPGATIIALGSSKGTITDVNGFFTMKAESGDSLKVCFIGYDISKIGVEGKEEIKVTMQPSLLALDEVVSVGYGVLRKSDMSGDLSGNIISKKSKENRVKNNKINEIDQDYEATPDSVKSQWAATKVEIQKQLLLKDKPALVLNLNQLKKLTNNKAKQDSIRMAIDWAEAGKFRKVEKLIEMLEIF